MLSKKGLSGSTGPVLRYPSSIVLMIRAGTTFLYASLSFVSICGNMPISFQNPVADVFPFYYTFYQCYWRNRPEWAQIACITMFREILLI